MQKYVYAFGGGTADGDGNMKDLLGGKGAGLAEMSRAGVPVPPGFTISPTFATSFSTTTRRFRRKWTNRSDGAREGRGTRRQEVRRRFRSAAAQRAVGREVLHAWHDEHDSEPRPERRHHRGLAEKTQNPRFAYDCYRRFIQMFGEVAMSIDMALFDEVFDERKHKAKVKLDTDLTEKDLKAVIEDYKKIVKKATKSGFRRTCASSSSCLATPCSIPGGRRKPLITARWRRSPTTGYGLQHPVDGVWQHGRHLLHRRRLHARSRVRREALLWRIPGERAGRRCGVGHPHAHRRSSR